MKVNNRFLTAGEWWDIMYDNAIMSLDDAYDMFHEDSESEYSANEVFEMVTNWEGGLYAYEIKRLLHALYELDF